MLDRFGAEMLERAVAEVVVRDQMNLRAVHHVRIPVNPGSQSGSTRSPVPDDPGAIGA
jgi:hypothetical protein